MNGSAFILLLHFKVNEMLLTSIYLAIFYMVTHESSFSFLFGGTLLWNVPVYDAVLTLE